MAFLAWVELLLRVSVHVPRQMALLLEPLVTLMALELLKPCVDVSVVGQAALIGEALATFTTHMIPARVEVHVLSQANLLMKPLAAFLAAEPLDANMEIPVLSQAALPRELLPAFLTPKPLDSCVACYMLEEIPFLPEPFSAGLAGEASLPGMNKGMAGKVALLSELPPADLTLEFLDPRVYLRVFNQQVSPCEHSSTLVTTEHLETSMRKRMLDKVTLPLYNVATFTAFELTDWLELPLP